MLKEATEKFESKFCTGTPIRSEEMGPSIMRILDQQHLPLTKSIVTWDIYIMYSYILWDR